MRKPKLDKEELELLESFENGEFVSIDNLSVEKERFKKIAQNTLKKDKRINLRISERDLFAIQKEANKEGIPYQTLISSIIHKYSSGLLKPVL
jgi:predicted DNA binding CopG/RHH family protein